MYKASSSQKRSGIALSYLGSAASLLTTLLLTPFLIGRLGTEAFGLYQMAISFAGYLIVLNMGLRLIVTRQVAFAVVEGEDKRLEERLGSVLYLLGLSLGLLAIGSVVSYFLLGRVFTNSLSDEQLRLVEVMFVVTLVSLVGQFVADVPLGILSGFELFRVSYGLTLLRLVLRLPLIVAAVALGFGPVGVVCVDALLNWVLVPLAWSLALRLGQVRIRLCAWNSKFLRQDLVFGAALALGAVSTQVNLAVSKVIVGAILGPVEVSSYAVALTIYTGFATVTMALGQVFVPNAVKVVAGSTSRAQISKFIARPGRFQLIIGAFVVIAFVLYGRSLIAWWVGAEMLSAWLPTILLLIPSLLVSVEIVCFAVMDAHQKRLVRSLVALGAAALSIVLTLVWVPEYGIKGAALACGLSILVGDVLIMNTYYHKRLNIDVVLLWRLLLAGTGRVIAANGIVFLLISVWAPEVSWSVAVQGVSFFASYCLGMYFFALQPDERAEVRRGLRLAPKPAGI